jgi:hypothetical protein
LTDPNYGEPERQILPDFRRVAESHSKTFMESKDHVLHLLGTRQNAESGLFREGLLRGFLERILPSAVAVDSGFIYGFEEVPTSKQLDIIIWHRAAHSLVYDTGQFVIVPPEAVIAVISVKSKMTLPELRHGLDNLLSVAQLDINFRHFLLRNGQSLVPVPPISKFLVFYSQPSSTKNILPTIGKLFNRTLAERPELAKSVVPPLQKVNPTSPFDPYWDEVRRVYPRLITTIEPGLANSVQGWGPPAEILAQSSYGPGMRRLPYMYRHDTKLTTAFEKLIFQLLSSVYRTLRTSGISLVSAWGDFNPKTGVRSGDAEEIVEGDAVPLLDPNNLAAFEANYG